MFRRPSAYLLAALAISLLAAPAIAQMQYVSAQSPSFSWTGKQDQQANFSWNATVDNPSKRMVAVHVTLHLLDANGDVISSDTQTTEVGKLSQARVSHTGSLAYADANRATDYRITVEGAES